MSRKTRSSKIVYENPWIEVTHNEIVDPNGNNGIYGKVHYKNKGVYVLVQNEKGEIGLVGQDRYPVNEYSREIPSGGVHDDEDVLDGARREIEEEMKLTPTKMKRYMELHQSNSVTDDICQVYIAEGCYPKEDVSHDTTEKIATSFVSLEEAYTMIQKGTIKEAATIAIITRFYLDVTFLGSELS